MPDSDSDRADDAPDFRSPKRALARAFRLSRDRWKQKAGQRRQQIKTLQVKVRDLQASRDLWKDKALHLQAQLEQLQGPVTPPPDDSPSAGTAQQAAADHPSFQAGEDAPADGQPPAGAAAPAANATPGPPPKKASRARR